MKPKIVRVAIIKGPSHAKMPSYLENSGVKGLHLSFHHGFSTDDPDFLAKLPFIELLEMPHVNPEHNLTALEVEALGGLRRIVALDKVAKTIDLPAFPNRQSRNVKWQPKTASVFQVKSLERLQICSLNCQKARGLADLQTLQNLEVAHSGIRSFEPISALKGLKRLSLSVCRNLASLGGIEQLRNLRCLHLDEVHKVTDLDCLTPLENLEVLTIADARDIKSVAP